MFNYLVSEFERRFAKITSELFPIIRVNAFKFLALFFGIKPRSYTLNMYKLSGALTFAWGNEWIFGSIFFLEADSAAHS